MKQRGQNSLGERGGIRYYSPVKYGDPLLETWSWKIFLEVTIREVTPEEFWK